MLEKELLVRDFVDALNRGDQRELAPFLAEDIEYRSSPTQVITGRDMVTSMLGEVRRTFEQWDMSLVHVAVLADVVLVEQLLRLALPGHKSSWVTGFASFTLREFHIQAWHQVYS